MQTRTLPPAGWRMRRTLGSKVVCAVAMAVVVVSTARRSTASDQIPGRPQSQPIVIHGATIHPVTSEPIENGAIVMENGKITAVGKNVPQPVDAQKIDASGKHVYPSLIEAYSDIGLVEINSIRATIDSRETGDMNPNVRAALAFNPDSELVPVNRANGILLAVSAPSGGRIAGLSAMMMLDGWTFEDMTLQADVGMHVSISTGRQALEDLDRFFDQARRYQNSAEDAGQRRDLRLEAMAQVLDRRVPMIAAANSIEEIRTAVALAKRHNVRLIIYGGADAARCAEFLEQQQVPVIVSGVYRSPRRRHDAYDDPYSLPKQLQDAGVDFCISAGGRFGASGIRNLPYHAATAAAYGLTEKEALEAITIRPARILGVADRVGALEVGRDATLFIADGNILETPTQVETAYIQGRPVDLDNKHRQLYRKYSAKYETEQ
jgi:imidazolonepropionase-like amidohydrolase